jgi:uncharacterized protein (TIGR02217 family)
VSALLYPTLPGLKFDSKRTLLWRTDIQEAVSGKETRISVRQFPLVRFDLEYELLRDYLATSELKSLVGFYNVHRGRWDSFLYTDPNHNSATLSSFGTGNGSAVAFQLVTRYQNTGGPGVDELVQNLNGAPSIYVGGALQSASAYAIGPTGIVTFNSAPANLAALTWSGSFYYRCRFDSDDMTATEFMRRFWKTGSIALRSIKL